MRTSQSRSPPGARIPPAYTIGGYKYVGLKADHPMSYADAFAAATAATHDATLLTGDRTKVVLVGDPAQLAEIDAGGLFRGLVNRLPIVELTENRRQRTPWERAVVDQLRTGQTRPAVAGYAERGRLTVLSPDEVVARVLDHWERLSEQYGPQSVVVIARTRRQVDQLNQQARQRCIAAGHITGPEVCTPRGQRFAAGDRVVCLRNDRRLDVDNGTQATVTAVHGPATGPRSAPAGLRPRGRPFPRAHPRPALPAARAWRRPARLPHRPSPPVPVGRPQGLAAARR